MIVSSSCASASSEKTVVILVLKQMSHIASRVWKGSFEARRSREALSSTIRPDEAPIEGLSSPFVKRPFDPSPPPPPPAPPWTEGSLLPTGETCPAESFQGVRREREEGVSAGVPGEGLQGVSLSGGLRAVWGLEG